MSETTKSKCRTGQAATTGIEGSDLSARGGARNEQVEEAVEARFGRCLGLEQATWATGRSCRESIKMINVRNFPGEK